MDSSCILWQDNCGERGSCWVYDNADLAVKIVAFLASIKIISLVFLILTLVLYKPPQELDMDLKVTTEKS